MFNLYFRVLYRVYFSENDTSTTNEYLMQASFSEYIPKTINKSNVDVCFPVLFSVLNSGLGFEPQSLQILGIRSFIVMSF
jgi:hypothetical protein